MKLTGIGPVVAVLGLAACGGPHSPSAPSAPAAASVPPSSDPVTRLQPTIADVSPHVVSTSGTWGTITGAEFQPGATVTIGNTSVTTVFRDSTTIQFPNSGAHAAGSVDITVTNPGGLAATLARGYTYTTAETFDANGDWIAHADAHNDFVTDMRFIVRNNTLVSLSCSTPVTMPTTVSVQNGGFSFAGSDGLALSGTLASTTTAYGQVTAPGCGDGRWWAEKAPASRP